MKTISDEDLQALRLGRVMGQLWRGLRERWPLVWRRTHEAYQALASDTVNVAYKAIRTSEKALDRKRAANHQLMMDLDAAATRAGRWGMGKAWPRRKRPLRRRRGWPV